MRREKESISLGTQMLLWDDNPSPVDLLGFEDVAAPVLGALSSEHLDPVCVGVFGPWGSGKTTVIELVQKRLEERNDMIVVYTQPWSYDPATDPKATLIGEVLNAVREQLDDSAATRLGEKIRGLAKRIRWSRAIRLAIEGAVTLSLPKLDDLEGIFGKEAELAEPTLQGFREDFAKLVEDEALSQYIRIVVVVDDLDRCLPKTVIETLEAIKLFLAVPKMAFVVAADELSVSAAIAEVFAGSDGDKSRAQQYIEKIVQIPVRVPALGQGDVEAYVAQLLLWQRLGGDAELFEPIRQACAVARARGQSTLVAGLAEDVEGADLDLALANRLSPIIYEELRGNPRRIKRLLNAYWIRADIARRRGVDLEIGAFAKLVLLEEVFPDEFRSMLGWLSGSTLEQNLKSLETGEGEFAAHFRRWGQLDPSLVGSDVGRYLILAAALQGTTITANTLPPELQELAKQLTSTQASRRSSGRRDLADTTPSDRFLLASHIANAIYLHPSRQDSLAESLMAVVGDSNEIAATASSVLKRVPHADIQPALVINLVPTNKEVRPPFLELVKSWESSDALLEDTAKSVGMALRENR